MKKYISIVIVLTALSVLSCDRSQEDLTAPAPEEFKTAVQRVENDISKEAKGSEYANDPDEDDEPRPDKQHWKINQDSCTQTITP